jgi:hypothetical protein
MCEGCVANNRQRAEQRRDDFKSKAFLSPVKGEVYETKTLVAARRLMKVVGVIVMIKAAIALPLYMRIKLSGMPEEKIEDLFGPFPLAMIFISILVGFGVFKGSRICGVALLVFQTINILYATSDPQLHHNLLGLIASGVFYLAGVIAIFRYHVSLNS